MGTSLTAAPLAEVRAAIARAVCGQEESPVSIGGITLVAAQRECVRRAREAISAYGGVLIASDVGSGKTYIALALAGTFANPLVIAPAALRTMWASAAKRAHRSVPFISFESLGRGHTPPASNDVVIVDEAHHLRNRLTRTYEAARAVTKGARVVLLSATPVHNRASDLDSLLELFLKSDARDLDDETRARIVVRSATSVDGPRVVVHPRVALPDSAEMIARINSLPPPIAVRDGGVATTLMRLSLLRAWCSSAGALAAMLRRATLRAAALGDALRSGRHLSRTELNAYSDDGQLAFAELIATGGVCDAAALRTIDSHLRALSSLRELVRQLAPLDNERARRLTVITNEHSGTGILACTQYAATVDAYWSRLRMRAGVAALTSRGARIASGPISRDDALARFAPIAQGARQPHDRERVRLLIATDLVSEGVNLHDAGVVVHLDLPWTAARVAQRVGRIARMGSPHPCVHAYELSPPNAADYALALTARLQRKRTVAARLVGGDKRFSELLGESQATSESAAEARARTVNALAPFAHEAPQPATPIVCAVKADRPGWLALVGDRYSQRLVASNGAKPTTNPRAAADAAELVAGATEGRLDPSLARQAESDVRNWLELERARRLAGIGRRHASRTHGRSLAAAIGAVTAAAPHERARAATTAAAALAEIDRGAQSAGAELLLALVVFCSDGIPPRRNSV